MANLTPPSKLSPGSASKPSRSTQGPAKAEGLDWEAVRDVFRQHYWVQDKELPEVMTLMKEEYGFIASKKQYKNQIEKWNLKKNVASEEYQAIVRIRKRRREEDAKDTVFTVRERPVPEEKIERFIKRHKAPDSPVAETPATPSDVGYQTPASPGSADTPTVARSPSPEDPASSSSAITNDFGSLQLKNKGDLDPDWERFLSTPAVPLVEPDAQPVQPLAVHAIEQHAGMSPLHFQVEPSSQLPQGAEHGDNHRSVVPGANLSHELDGINMLDPGSLFAAHDDPMTDWLHPDVWATYHENAQLPDSDALVQVTSLEASTIDYKAQEGADVSLSPVSKGSSIEDQMEEMSLDGDNKKVDDKEDAESTASDDTEVPSRHVGHEQETPSPATMSLSPSSSQLTPASSPSGRGRLARLGHYSAPVNHNSALLPPTVVATELDRSLHKAVMDGDLAAVRSLLRAGANVEAPVDHGMAALHVATCWGHPLIVAELLDHGADPRSKVAGTFSKVTRVGDSSTLMAMGAVTALDIAACLDDTCLIRLILSGLPYDLDQLVGWSLGIAAALGNLRSLSILSQRATSYHLTEGLIKASKYGQEEAVVALLEFGADLNGHMEKSIPFPTQAEGDRWPGEHQHRKIAAIFKDRRNITGGDRLFSELTPLVAATACGSYDVVDTLLDKGARVNDCALRRGPPLLIACRRADVHIARLLLANRADPNPPTVLGHFYRGFRAGNPGFTPLAAAVFTGSRELVQMLIGCNAVVDALSAGFEENPLRAAIGAGNLDVVRILLEYGADVSGTHALEYLSDKNMPEVARLLFDHGAWMSDGARERLLERCIRVGAFDAVKFLLEGVSERDTRNCFTPKTLHAAADDVGMMNLLIEHGALSVLHTDSRWQGPLSAAFDAGNAQTARLLLTEQVLALFRDPEAGWTEYYQPVFCQKLPDTSANAAVFKLMLDAMQYNPDNRTHAAWGLGLLSHVTRLKDGIESVRHLIERGVEFNLENGEPNVEINSDMGDSQPRGFLVPLLSAANVSRYSQADEAAVEFLLEQGADGGWCSHRGVSTFWGISDTRWDGWLNFGLEVWVVMSRGCSLGRALILAIGSLHNDDSLTLNLGPLKALLRHTSRVCDRCLAISLLELCRQHRLPGFAAELLERARPIPEAVMILCLHASVGCGNLEAAKSLVAKLGEGGWSIDQSTGHRLLVRAITTPDRDKDDEKYDALKPDSWIQGNTLDMIRRQRVEIVQWLLADRVTLVDIVDPHGKTPLYLALEQLSKSPTRQDLIAVIESLIQASGSATINRPTDEGCTPLMKACSTKVPTVIRLLLSAGADWTFQNESGEDALTCAAQTQDLDSVRILLHHALDKRLDRGHFGLVHEFVDRWYQVWYQPEDRDKVSDLIVKELCWLFNSRGVLQDFRRTKLWLPTEDDLNPLSLIALCRRPLKLPLSP